jgi:hypothetical protein
MGFGMTALSTLKGNAGAPAGSIVPLSNLATPAYAIINGKQYLKTGTLVTYNSAYASLASGLPGAGFFTPDASNGNWLQNNSGGQRFLYKNGKYFWLFGGLTQIPAGSSLTTTPTNETAVNGYSISDGVEFGNYLIVCGESTQTRVNYSTGNGAWTNAISYTFSQTSCFWRFLAASPSLCVVLASQFINDGEQSYKIATTTNGTSWTYRTPSILGSIYPARFFWSTAANAFVMITSEGAIYTTTDGYTFTSRTAPSGMPTTINANYNLLNQSTVAESSTATLCSLGSGKYLRVTGITSYSVVDLSANHGTSPSLIRPIAYDGSKFWLGNFSGSSALYYSTDNGLTFSPSFSMYNAQYLTNNFQVTAVSYVNGKHIVVANYRPYDVSTKLTANPTVPDLVGVLTNSYLDVGGNIGAFLVLT